MTDHETRDTPAPPAVKPHPSWIIGCVQRGRRYIREHRTKIQEEGAQDRASRRTANATIWIAILTAVTIAVGISQYIIFGRQLDVMENDKRPWISVEVSIQDYVILTEWAESRGINIPLK